MGDSFEKRQRERRKQQKRQDKLARRRERPDTKGAGTDDVTTLEEMLGFEFTDEVVEGEEEEDGEDESGEDQGGPRPLRP